MIFFRVLSQRENPNYAYQTHQINIQNPDENLIVARPDRAQSHKAFLIKLAGENVKEKVRNGAFSCFLSNRKS